MTPQKLCQRIQTWIGRYVSKHNLECLVVGISGGIDSSVVSALCAETGVPTIAVVMPIRQSSHTHNLSQAHGEWLRNRYDNVTVDFVELDPVFDAFEAALIDRHVHFEQQQLAWANSRSRLRMMTLYQIAQSNGGIVVGTGNRVEDFGVGFFTKYGDGGVDISPIGDCLKTQVWDMGRHLGILPEIIEAAPTDGLWDDGRTDENQLGMDYGQLEVAMLLDETGAKPINPDQARRLRQYRAIRRRNLHKMQPIPVCPIAK